MMLCCSRLTGGNIYDETVPHVIVLDPGISLRDLIRADQFDLWADGIGAAIVDQFLRFRHATDT